MLVPAFGRLCRETNRQDEIDEIHPAPVVASAALARYPANIPAAELDRSVPRFL
jgi:hypothetical protein